MKHRSSRVIAALAVAVLAAALGQSVQRLPKIHAIPDTPVGTYMLEFNLKDLDGKEHRMTDHKGKIIVLCSWSTLCPYSRAIDPYIEELVQEYADKGVTFYGVDAQEVFAPVPIRDYLKKNGLTFTILEDPRNYFLRDLKAREVPEFFVVDQNLRLAYRGSFDDRLAIIDPGNTPFVKNAIDDLLAGRPVALPKTPFKGCLTSNLVEDE